MFLTGRQANVPHVAANNTILLSKLYLKGSIGAKAEDERPITYWRTKKRYVECRKKNHSTFFPDIEVNVFQDAAGEETIN